MSITIITAELTLAGKPARSLADAQEVLRRVGMSQSPVFAEPELVDAESGIWNIDVAVIHLYHLRTDGHLVRQFGNSSVTAEWPR